MTDKEVRDQAVRNLAAFLSRGGDPEDEDAEERSGYIMLSEKEMAKLWKGLFYCECAGCGVYRHRRGRIDEGSSYRAVTNG